MLVKSPCIGICTYGKKNKETICRGCCRTPQEITDWSSATNARKREIKSQAEARKKALTSSTPSSII